MADLFLQYKGNGKVVGLQTLEFLGLLLEPKMAADTKSCLYIKIVVRQVIVLWSLYFEHYERFKNSYLLKETLP